jgi:hypothetical protein
VGMEWQWSFDTGCIRRQRWYNSNGCTLIPAVALSKPGRLK